MNCWTNPTVMFCSDGARVGLLGGVSGQPEFEGTGFMTLDERDIVALRSCGNVVLIWSIILK